MSGFDTKYENWKNKLLDLGKRNRLLNYKETAGSTLRITFPAYGDLYDTFVREEKALPFPREPYGTSPDEPLLLPAPGANPVVDYGGKGSVLRSNRTLPELQKVLRNLRGKARIALEEQGVNILYLSFGFLEYTEKDRPGETFRAPLVLVPVTLTVESVAAPFVMKLREDEIVVNPTLAYKLDLDTGLKLPAFDADGSLSDFFDAAQALVRPNHWSVSREVGLSLLSYLKINMYADLETHKSMVENNPVVRALAGDASFLPPFPADVNDYDFDRNDHPADVFQIVDADASQQEAILLAQRGVSFILQGPPGTGKSQTITNIIAQCLGEGKKVLFVSEKMAALEVVYHRLSLAGLGDFCLVLHSQKTSKRSVLDQLEKVLLLADKKASVSDAAMQSLEDLAQDRTDLNEYADQIYAVVEPLGRRIFDVYGILAGLRDAADIVFTMENVRGVGSGEYAQLMHLLRAYGDTVGKLTEDFRTNPWRGALVPAATNEFRRSTAAGLAQVLPVLDGVRQRTDAVYDALFLPGAPSLNGMRDAAALLEDMENARTFPAAWIEEDFESLAAVTEDCARLQAHVRTLQEQIGACLDTLRRDGISLSAPDPSPCNSADAAALNDTVLQHLRQKAPFSVWYSEPTDGITALFDEAEGTAGRIRALREELSAQYEDAVYEIDYEGVLARYKTEYTGVFKSFKPSYKADRKAFLAASREVGRKLTDAQILDAIGKLREIDALRRWFPAHAAALEKYFGAQLTGEDGDFRAVRRLLSAYSVLTQLSGHLESLGGLLLSFERAEASLGERFGFLFNGVFTDWDAVRAALGWAGAFTARVRRFDPGERFVKEACSSAVYAEACVGYRNELIAAESSLREALTWFTALFEDPEVFYGLNLRELADRLDDCRTGMPLLEEWIDYRNARQACGNAGLQNAVDALETARIPREDIIPVFQKHFFNLWLDAVLPEYPAVLRFRRERQADRLEAFARLDRAQFGIACARIKSKLINDLPSVDHFTSGTDEIGTLKHELNKTRKIKPIRRLFGEIPNLLRTLKPCLMMSPLSVSLFLEADAYLFDTVIFDEASQVYTENAIGAIARGKQVIIAGDSKQLPPTSFFRATAAEEQYDDEDADDADPDVYDSVLDEANLLPERTLRWHYRSRHENLIAFSNAKIYKNRLITFPSNIERGKDNGVEFIYVPDGFYDRGGRKGNVIEAHRVADMVFAHFAEHPERSLGVIAFGEVQQYAIENVLREKRLADRSFEPFFDETAPEPFFVKSLENVQGDERDTIIFSIGYAKDASGVFRNQFGPLGNTGGERRLNVAVTRAKYNVKLVGSILPSDINENAVTTQGPKLLKAYMEYAVKGPESLGLQRPDEAAAAAAPSVLTAVCACLKKNGYAYDARVGCSDYRVDIGVKHPAVDGVYVLGIECDGDAYHSGRTARERERLRHEVLKNMGWTIYRVWSADWAGDPEAAEQALIDAVEAAVKASEGGEPPAEALLPDADVYFSLDDEVKTPEQLKNPYGFAPYVRTDLSDLPRDRYGYVRIDDCIRKLVENEFPIHFEYLCQRLAYLYGNEKATVKVRREVELGLQRLSGKIVRKGDFLYPASGAPVTVRVPNSRKIQHISAEEFAAAMLVILGTYVGGAARKTLCLETARVYGFGSAGSAIAAVLNEAVGLLLTRGLITETDGRLCLTQTET